MILIEKAEIVGFEQAIRGMRNPMNSWDKSDSLFIDTTGDYHTVSGDSGPYYGDNEDLVLGTNDHELMTKLVKGGPVHAKFRRMITAYVAVTAPLYWWKEFDTYKVGRVANFLLHHA